MNDTQKRPAGRCLPLGSRHSLPHSVHKVTGARTAARRPTRVPRSACTCRSSCGASRGQRGCGSRRLGRACTCTCSRTQSCVGRRGKEWAQRWYWTAGPAVQTCARTPGEAQHAPHHGQRMKDAAVRQLVTTSAAQRSSCDSSAQHTCASWPARWWSRCAPLGWPAEQRAAGLSCWRG